MTSTSAFDQVDFLAILNSGVVKVNTVLGVPSSNDHVSFDVPVLCFSSIELPDMKFSAVNELAAFNVDHVVAVRCRSNVGTIIVPQLVSPPVVFVQNDFGSIPHSPALDVDDVVLVFVDVDREVFS